MPEFHGNAFIKKIEDSVPPSRTADVARKFREDIDSGATAECAKLIARAKMIQYRAYIAAGFDEHQALFLVGK